VLMRKLEQQQAKSREPDIIDLEAEEVDDE
jgi:hypothetical protein